MWNIYSADLPDCRVFVSVKGRLNMNVPCGTFLFCGGSAGFEEVIARVGNIVVICRIVLKM